ncbi:uncharacterized protein METZ01_LOCUS228784 [marine metagenome]|uniref:Uncharacterized protein n=1 Tax=marine metagenome TaxID=408172 RepID=A0A382GLC5_9ZZZZ
MNEGHRLSIREANKNIPGSISIRIPNKHAIELNPTCLGIFNPLTGQQEPDFTIASLSLAEVLVAVITPLLATDQVEVVAPATWTTTQTTFDESYVALKSDISIPAKHGMR